MRKGPECVVSVKAALVFAVLGCLSIPAEAVGDLECPPEGIVEGEPTCFDGYVDSYNGGCDCDPPAFVAIEPSNACIVICGEGGTFLLDDFETRDTDWYEITPPETSVITYCGVAEYPVMILLLDGRGGCAGVEVLDFAIGTSPFEEVCVVDTLAPGTYWLWTAPSVFEGVECGLEYLLTVSGYCEGPMTPVASTGSSVPVALAVENSPNPFNPATTIRFSIPMAGPVSVTVHDIAGRRVATLADGVYQPGEFAAAWDGKDASGADASSGLYFARLHAGEYGAVRKMVLLK